MALDDIVNESIKAIGNHNAVLRDTVNRIKSGQGPTDDGKFEDEQTALFLNYTRDDIPDEYDGSFSDELGEHIETVNSLPEEEKNAQIIKHLPSAHKTARDRLVKRVEPNYTAILDELDGQNLFNLFAQAPLAENTHDKYEQTRKAKREFDKWERAVKTGDTDVYTASVTHPVIREILKKYRDSELIKKFMQNRMARAQEAWLRPYADIEKLQEAMKNKDRKAVEEALKTDEIRKYLLANTSALSEEPKIEAYEITGITYSNYLIEKAKQERNDGFKESLEEAEK